MISPLIRMGFLSVSWAYVCIKMDMRLPNTERNTDAQKQIGNVAVSASIPVHRRNTAGRYISLPMTIQGYLTYRQETVKHGERNMAEGLPWNVLTNVRKKIFSNLTVLTDSSFSLLYFFVIARIYCDDNCTTFNLLCDASHPYRRSQHTLGHFRIGNIHFDHSFLSTYRFHNLYNFM